MGEQPIIFSDHALESMARRGATEEEVEETIRSKNWYPAHHQRLETKKDFLFNAQWNKGYYKTKQVNPVFIVEQEKIIVITVYVFYF